MVVHVFNFVILDVLLEGRRDGSSFGKDEIPKKGLKISLWILQLQNRMLKSTKFDYLFD